MAKLKNPKREAFCLEYMKDRNSSAASIRAGYSPKNPNVTGPRLLADVSIAARIAELEAKFAEKAGISIEDTLRRYVSIATADRNELTSIEVSACRWCHGVDHEYQWRTEREFRAAMAAWSDLPDIKRLVSPMPTDDGGYGFTTRSAPVMECPECDGHGESHTRFHDTTRLSESGQTIFAGVKRTKDGIEVKTLDAQAALDQIARHLGMFDKDNRRTHDVTDKFADFLAAVNKRGSKAELTAERRAGAKGEGEADA